MTDLEPVPPHTAFCPTCTARAGAYIYHIGEPCLPGKTWITGADSVPASPLEMVLSGLYRSEINASIAWVHDHGFTVQIGDEANGVRAVLCTWEVYRIAPWLHQAAMEYYPTSRYAREQCQP